MSKVVFYGFPMYAHMIQTLPLVQELVSRGEEVIYFANDKYKHQVEKAGATFRDYLSEYSDDPSELAQNYHEFMEKVYKIIQDALVNLEKIKPDYLIYDRSAMWVPVIAENLNLPTVCTISSIVLNQQVLSLQPAIERLIFYSKRPSLVSLLPSYLRALAIWRRIRKDFSFTKKFLPTSQADMVLANYSRQFQPFVDSLDDRYKFIGWLSSKSFRENDIDFPWDKIKGEKLIYISLGTTFNRDSNFFMKCFDSFKDSEYQVVISKGKGKHLSIDNEAPPNVILADWVPQLEILERADVFVTQGGTSSVCESLNFGCPVVVVPQMAEQHIMGHWVEKIGVGKHLKYGNVSVSNLRSAVDEVIANTEYRENSIKIGDSFRSSGGVQTAVDEIYKLKVKLGI